MKSYRRAYSYMYGKYIIFESSEKKKEDEIELVKALAVSESIINYSYDMKNDAEININTRNDL